MAREAEIIIGAEIEQCPSILLDPDGVVSVGLDKAAAQFAAFLPGQLGTGKGVERRGGGQGVGRCHLSPVAQISGLLKPRT